MNTLHFKKSAKSATGILLGIVMLAPACVTSAQTNEEQELAARRQAILQQDQVFTEDGQIVDPDAVRVPPPEPVAPWAVRTSEPQAQTVYRPVGWRVRSYGRPYAGYYYGPPRGRYYARYPSYYNPYYGGYDYGYRGSYYGTPRFGYYDYPYGGAARVGPVRVFWR